MPRTVNADEARACAYAPAHVSPGEVVDLAHTVVVQAEQIAAVRASHFPLVDSNGPWSCEACDITYGWPCPTARALGVTA